jgi:Tol biopolymer transport system component
VGAALKRRVGLIAAGLLLVGALGPVLGAEAGSGGAETTMVSVASDGSQADSWTFSPSISADGRFIAFYSLASNLTPADTNDDWDVFVHDRATGETSRMSVSSRGQQANGDSSGPSISADGRFVAFSSEASNLVRGDPPRAYGETGIFVHDRETGATSLVSVNSRGRRANKGSDSPAISAHGRFVAFRSRAVNLVRGDTNRSWDVFLHDRKTGRTRRVSVNSRGAQADGDSVAPSISADGRLVAFSSAASLVNADRSRAWDIFVRSWKKGKTMRVSVRSNGRGGDRNSDLGVISANGRVVAFMSKATNLVRGDTNRWGDIFVHDRRTGRTTRVSISSGAAEANRGSSVGEISASGRFVVFGSEATNLVENDANARTDVFVHDRQTGETTRVNISTAGEEANSYSYPYADISSDGRFVTFISSASNLVPGVEGTSNFHAYVRGPLW